MSTKPITLHSTPPSQTSPHLLILPLSISFPHVVNRAPIFESLHFLRKSYRYVFLFGVGTWGRFILLHAEILRSLLQSCLPLRSSNFVCQLQRLASLVPCCTVLGRMVKPRRVKTARLLRSRTPPQRGATWMCSVFSRTLGFTIQLNTVASPAPTAGGFPRKQSTKYCQRGNAVTLYCISFTFTGFSRRQRDDLRPQVAADDAGPRPDALVPRREPRAHQLRQGRLCQTRSLL